MELEIYEIQRDLKAILKEKKFSNDIDVRIRNICSQLIRIKDCLIHTYYIGGVCNQYRELIRNFYMVDNTTMLNLIQNLEDAVIFNLIIHLRIPETTATSLIQQSRSQSSNQSLDFILPNVLSFCVSNVTFLDFWNIYMPFIFEAFQIPANDFVKCLA